MRQYRFMALVMLDPAGRGEAARLDPGGTQACCLIEPSYCTYFPAVISLDWEVPSRAKVHALVTVALSDGEARAFFGPGQRFAIWADAVVGHSVQATGLAGHGVIFQRVAPLVPRLSRRAGQSRHRPFGQINNISLNGALLRPSRHRVSSRFKIH